jgi:hypothetical protein
MLYRSEFVGFNPDDGSPVYNNIPIERDRVKKALFSPVPQDVVDKIKAGKAKLEFGDPDNPSWQGPSVNVDGIIYSGDYGPNGELRGFKIDESLETDGGRITGYWTLDNTPKPTNRANGSFLQVVAPLLATAANAIAPGVGTAISAANTLSQGGSVLDVLKSAAVSQGLSALGNAAAPEVDLNAATSDFQDVYGGNLPIEDIAAAFEPAVPEAVTVGAAIPTPDIVPTPLPAIESSVVQPDYFSVDAGPLADTTQDLESIIPPENPFLAGMEETTAIEGAGVAGAENPTGTYTGGANYLSGMEETAATEGAGVAGADNPTGTTVTVPDTVQEATKNLTPKQAYQLLKLGAGLFGGAGALTAAAQGLMGGGTGGGMAMPSIQAPTPFTGTYSGMNPYDAAYFQQVQQNYNRLFPTTPANIAGPLESWYQTKYVPDTTISNKLFGV